jgi:hypothetical protein
MSAAMCEPICRSLSLRSNSLTALALVLGLEMVLVVLSDAGEGERGGTSAE